MKPAIHTDADLRQLQSLPLEQKVLLTKKRIREWYDHLQGQVYVSFSGGKDSTVLKHIVDSIYDDVPAVWVNTGLEYPEVQSFVRDVKDGKHEGFNPDVVIVRPEKTFKQVIEECGYPIVSKEVAQIVREARIGLARGDGSYMYRIKKLRGELLDKQGNKSKYNQKKWGFLVDAPFKISEQCCDETKKKPAQAYERDWQAPDHRNHGDRKRAAQETMDSEGLQCVFREAACVQSNVLLDGAGRT